MRRDFDPLLASLAHTPDATPPIVGRVLDASAPLAPLVTFAGAPDGGVVARTCATLGCADQGQSVVLLFEGHDVRRPIVMGVIRSAEHAGTPASEPDTLRISAKRQVVLECGKSSLTLTDAGKVLIKGAYVLSSSSGTNRIRGGSVEIN